MPRVLLPSALRSLAGGAETVELPARSVRELIRALDERFPGMAAELGAGMAVAIDGEILHDAELEPLTEGSEVQFLPALRGG